MTYVNGKDLDKLVSHLEEGYKKWLKVKCQLFNRKGNGLLEAKFTASTLAEEC